MNRIDKLLGKYFLIVFPLIGVLLIIGKFYGEDDLSKISGPLRYLNDFFGWMLIVWIAVSLYLFIKMIVSSNFRDKTMKNFVRIKDADERESIVSGEAAKLSMLSTFALMTFLLFLSMMSISVGKIQGEQLLKSDNKHFISIGIDPLLASNKKEVLPNDGSNDQEIFTYRGLPLPTSVILLFILAWQLVSYHLIVRKSLRE